MYTSSFALGVSSQHTETGEEVLRMCVAVKKKLQLYFWKDREFHELQVKSMLIHRLKDSCSVILKVRASVLEFSPGEGSAVST